MINHYVIGKGQSKILCDVAADVYAVTGDFPENRFTVINLSVEE